MTTRRSSGATQAQKDVCDAAVTAESLVINELLCFVMNKRKLMPDDTIIQLCIGYYDEEAIEVSKKLLFNLCADPGETRDRYIGRSGASKKQNNLKDILDFITRKGGKLPVTFAAIELSNLPCISFNNIDVCSLLSRMEKMQSDVALLKRSMESQASTSSDLSAILEDLAHPANRGDAVKALPKIPSDDAETSKHARLPNEEKSSAKRTNVQEGIPGENRNNVHRDANTDEMFKEDILQGWTKVVKKRKHSGNDQRNNNRQVSQGDERHNSTMRQNGRKTIMGRGKNIAIKPAKKRTRSANVFASRLDPNLQVEDLQAYLAHALDLSQDIIEVELIRRSEWHSSFHIKCQCPVPTAFLNADIWPLDAYVRWWRESKQKDPSDNISIEGSPQSVCAQENHLGTQPPTLSGGAAESEASGGDEKDLQNSIDRQ